MSILETVLFIGLIVAGFMIYNLISQVEQLQNKLDNNIDVEDRAINIYRFILSALVRTYQEMLQVDKKGAFQSDDEVGFSFKTIKELIEQCKTEIQRINPVESQDITGE